MADTEKQTRPTDKAPDVPHFLDLMRQQRRSRFNVIRGTAVFNPLLNKLAAPDIDVVILS
ncbi:MAG TPA: hypothetical protein VHE54_00090 [Puia sp.]|nr:hypothetical protein [Puia sp.]